MEELAAKKAEVVSAISDLQTQLDNFNEKIRKIKNEENKFDENLSSIFESWSDILNIAWDTSGSNVQKQHFNRIFPYMVRNIKEMNEMLDSLKEIGKISFDSFKISK